MKFGLTSPVRKAMLSADQPDAFENVVHTNSDDCLGDDSARQTIVIAKKAVSDRKTVRQYSLVTDASWRGWWEITTSKVL